MLQCVIVRFCVLHCTAVCCSNSVRIAVDVIYCGVLQCVAVMAYTLLSIRSVAVCVAACYSVL